MKKLELHAKLCKKLTETYAKKNHDYGDSFARGYNDYGMISGIVRISDKLHRLEALSENDALVKDETAIDTALDLANYGIMLAMEMLYAKNSANEATDQQAP